MFSIQVLNMFGIKLFAALALVSTSLAEYCHKEGCGVKKEAHQPLQQDLNGVWQVTNRNGSIGINGNVPGTMYGALMDAGIIGDPYFRFNDNVYRWVHWDDWTYSRAFTVEEETLSRDVVNLVFEGLDTISTVYVNGATVGRSDNQFVRYIFNVKSSLVVGKNILRIDFQSAPRYAEQRFLDHPYVIPPYCPYDEYNPECHSNMIRKAQCSFSWDWGPAFATQGVWLPAYLEAYDSAKIRDILVVPSSENFSTWKIEVRAILETPMTEEQQVTVTARIDELDVEESVSATVQPGQNTVSIELNNVQAEPWWPRGYGEPRLYDLKVSVGEDSKTIRTGFRTIELVEEEISTGLTFYFKINAIPIFMKGANWIPVDSFYDRVDEARFRYLLESALETNMNTIRIWGGGTYEPNVFYDIADELGIMVWQDCMFACAMYPVDGEFLSTVHDEVLYQVRRLDRHPSVVAWSSNNENEGALVDDWYGTRGPLYDRYKKDYRDLYTGIIRSAILELDTSRPYLSSSPSNGLITEQSGWISEEAKPSDPNYGDVHYYNYIDDCLDPAIFPRTRYSSEYGYQSWPNYATLAKVSDPDDLVYFSPYFVHRQHKMEAGNGTDQLIRRHFNWPESGDAQEDFKSYIYLSQVIQALCYRAQTEFYRRSRDDPEIRGMGALYWQHNDIWQAPSWATIDFEGNWKIAHNYAADFFADMMVSPLQDGDQLSIWVISDLLDHINDVDLIVRVYSWSSFTPVHSGSYPIDSVESLKSELVATLDLTTSVDPLCSSRSACFMTLELAKDGVPLTPVAPHYLTNFKALQGLADPNLQVTVIEGTNSKFEVTVTSDAPAVFVTLESGDIIGHFSDNGFLMTSSSRTVSFKGRFPVTLEDLQAAVTVKSLYSIL